MGNPDVILEMRNISKSFPGVQALKDVSLTVRSGKVLALMGENGAGKSTLMKILQGIYKPDQGEIVLKGRRVEIDSPKDALRLGISMIHQELSPVLEMTVAENIFLGREPHYRYTGIVNRKKLRRDTLALFQDIGIEMNPNKKLSQLSVAEMQLVEIVKAISYNSDIIIMDEPTSAITDREVEKLFQIIKRLTDRGKAIIYISHKMDEIFRICDEIVVLRDGQFIDAKPIGELDQNKLISLMVGRELNNVFPKETAGIGETILEVENLGLDGKFRGVSFRLRRGEILGLAGLMGAGRTEVAETIFGIHHATEGEIRIKGKPVRIKSCKDAIDNGIALVSEDRKLKGLNLKASVQNNITLSSLLKYSVLRQIVNPRLERTVVEQQIEALNIKTPSRKQIVNFLSGGNQQKVVIGKWLLCEPDVLILDEPTRGIDVGAKYEIYKMMNLLAKEGKAILMISSEMPELLGMSDRVIVLHEGEVTGEFLREEFDQEKIMACAAGFKKGEIVA